MHKSENVRRLCQNADLARAHPACTHTWGSSASAKECDHMCFRPATMACTAAIATTSQTTCIVPGGASTSPRCWESWKPMCNAKASCLRTSAATRKSQKACWRCAKVCCVAEPQCKAQRHGAARATVQPGKPLTARRQSASLHLISQGIRQRRGRHSWKRSIAHPTGCAGISEQPPGAASTCSCPAGAPVAHVHRHHPWRWHDERGSICMYRRSFAVGYL
jgi:hypothetical protein